MIRPVHRISEHHAVIQWGQGTQALRVYQFSDTHLDLWDERDQENTAHWVNLQNPPQPPRGADLLYQHVRRAQEGNADVMVFAGDAFHFPSLANVEVARDVLSRCPIPVLFTPGNHDWFFPGMDGWESLRRQWIGRLNTLTEGQPGFRVVDAPGLRFVLVDNSTYVVDQSQLQHTREALQTSLPVVVVQHIPVSLPTLRDSVIAKHGQPILMGDPANANRPPRPESDPAATQAYLDLLTTHPQVVAILSAHVHLDHVDSLNPRVAQYVCDAGYRGGFRFLDFHA